MFHVLSSTRPADSRKLGKSVTLCKRVEEHVEKLNPRHAFDT